jgi:hypothetical protein
VVVSTDSKRGNDMQWIETEPGQVWRSADGRYAIVAHTLPENPPRTQYQARKIDPAMAAAHPHRGTLGYLLDESPWCWKTENSVHSAEAVVDRDVFKSAHNTSVPEDHPAVALSRFFWPISQGTSRAALAVVWKDGSLVAQVLGMVRRDDSGFVPAPYTEIDLTDLGLVAHDASDLETVTDHGPPPCGNCGVKVGQPHDETCSRAKCLVTGEQRLLCTYFGESPVAGIETLATGGSQEEFETYFKADLQHDCGQDVHTAKS